MHDLGAYVDENGKCSSSLMIQREHSEALTRSDRVVELGFPSSVQCARPSLAQLAIFEDIFRSESKGEPRWKCL